MKEKPTPLETRMTELNLRQLDLAKRARVPVSVVNQIVRRHTRSPKLLTGIRLARALQLETIADLERLFPAPPRKRKPAPVTPEGTTGA